MDLVLKNARIAGRETDSPTNVAIRDGRIAAIGKDVPAARKTIDLAGALLSPGFVESHIHLDKSRVFDRARLVTGQVPEAFKEVLRLKAGFTPDDVRARAVATLERSILHGVTHMRTHLETDPTVGLRSLDAVLPLIEEYRWAIDIEICIFPEEGLLDLPGTEELLREGLKRGCRVIGAAPEADKDAHGQIDRIFEIAREFDVDIDMHLDFGETGDDMLIEYVCDKADRFRYGGRVSAAHLTKLSTVPRERFRAVCKRMADSGVAATVLPATDLYLMARTQEFNVVRGVTPIHLMLAEGVSSSLATNNVLNPMTPFGDGSTTRIMNLYANIAQLWRHDDFATCFDLFTIHPAKTLKIADYGIAAGAAADLVVLPVQDRAHALMEIARPTMAFKRGRQTFWRDEAALHRPAAAR